MGAGEDYFELEVIAELIEQEFAAMRRWLDLRKQSIHRCRKSPRPPDDALQKLRLSGDEVLRRLGEINRLLMGAEATFMRPPEATWLDLANGRSEQK
jgi:hypothetical protein